MIFDYCCADRSQKDILRCEICYAFTEILDAPTAEYWTGHNGTICEIRRILQVGKDQRNMDHCTLIDIMLCICTRLEFNGKLNAHKNCGLTIILKTGDTEEHLIADWMETGAGFCLTTEIVNKHLRTEVKCEVSRYCVMSSFYCMNPQITTTRKVVSGGNNDKWINTRGNYTKQFQIMLGKLTEEQIMTNAEVLRVFCPILPWFDPTLLPKLTGT